MALGTFYARQRRTADAEAQFRSAMALDASFVPTYVNFADFYRAQRRDDDAERLLRDGIDHVPESGTLQHALGLTLVRLGRKDEALQSLQRATVLAPDDARFAYVYAVGLHSSGRPALAIAELKRALTRHPGDRDLTGALAAMQRDAGLRGRTRSSEGVVTSPE